MASMQITPAVWIHYGPELAARAIDSVSEMIVVLDRWPYARRNVSYQVAVEMAQKATACLVMPDCARDAYRTFAAEAEILAESRTP